jgi:hypothetical protein
MHKIIAMPAIPVILLSLCGMILMFPQCWILPIAFLCMPHGLSIQTGDQTRFSYRFSIGQPLAHVIKSLEIGYDGIYKLVGIFLKLALSNFEAEMKHLICLKKLNAFFRDVCRETSTN